MMLKNMVEPDRPQMTIWYDAENIWFFAGYTKERTQMHNHSI